MFFRLFLLLWSSVVISATLEPDPNGYIMFCPCMGRFGNQADHYLGALGFAKGLNRTLILPHWVEYRIGEAKSIQVPFDVYFDPEPLKEFHRVVLMDEFMEQLATKVWPEEKRISFCYSFRQGPKPASCNAKDGNPFGPFWNHFGIDFMGSEDYGPLHYDVHRTNIAEEWNKEYPAKDWPVLAFTGAPAAFPVQEENLEIQKYLVWNKNMHSKAEAFIQKNLAYGPFIGIHLRNGVDWKRACEFINSSPTLFSAAQCVGYRNEFGPLTQDICQPSEEVIVKHLRRAIKTHSAKSIFIASDHDHMINILSKHFSRTDLKLVKLDDNDPHLDLVILGKANHFIGNCVSSFTAFVKRERDGKGLGSSFWGFPPSKRAADHHDPGEF